ncbi:MAG: hypothetical protein EAZ08_02325 [Cytophagales bacterium]|nr:MAG: hypothetical protein EAZ08_02325 [Cytophagales bacterium]
MIFTRIKWYKIRFNCTIIMVKILSIPPVSATFYKKQYILRSIKSNKFNFLIKTYIVSKKQQSEYL